MQRISNATRNWINRNHQSSDKDEFSDTLQKSPTKRTDNINDSHDTQSQTCLSSSPSSTRSMGNSDTANFSSDTLQNIQEIKPTSTPDRTTDVSDVEHFSEELSTSTTSTTGILSHLSSFATFSLFGKKKDKDDDSSRSGSTTNITDTMTYQRYAEISNEFDREQYSASCTYSVSSVDFAPEVNVDDLEVNSPPRSRHNKKRTQNSPKTSSSSVPPLPRDLEDSLAAFQMIRKASKDLDVSKSIRSLHVRASRLESERDQLRTECQQLYSMTKSQASMLNSLQKKTTSQEAEIERLTCVVSQLREQSMKGSSGITALLEHLKTVQSLLQETQNDVTTKRVSADDSVSSQIDYQDSFRTAQEGDISLTSKQDKMLRHHTASNTSVSSRPTQSTNNQHNVNDLDTTKSDNISEKSHSSRKNALEESNVDSDETQTSTISVTTATNTNENDMDDAVLDTAHTNAVPAVTDNSVRDVKNHIMEKTVMDESKDTNTDNRGIIDTLNQISKDKMDISDSENLKAVINHSCVDRNNHDTNTEENVMNKSSSVSESKPVIHFDTSTKGRLLFIQHSLSHMQVRVSEMLDQFGLSQEAQTSIRIAPTPQNAQDSVSKPTRTISTGLHKFIETDNLPNGKDLPSSKVLPAAESTDYAQTPETQESLKPLTKTLEASKSSTMCCSVKKRRGLRILSLDGGGVRGLLMIDALRRIEQDTGRRIHEMFDLICGTSTGGFLAVLIGINRVTLDEAAARYEKIRTTFGGQNAIWSELKRFTTGSSHDATAFQKFLQDTFGDDKMGETAPTPKVFVVSTAVDMFPAQPYLFRNYELSAEARAAAEFMGTSSCKLAEAVQATTCAPTYYTPAVIGGQKFVDGAIVANNPTAIALSEASVLWPGTPIDCVVSLGCGTQTWRPNNVSSVMAWVRTVVDLGMNSHVTHKIVGTLLGPELYFRFDADGQGDVDLIEHRREVLDKMLAKGRKYIEREHARFQLLTDILLAKSKSNLNKISTVECDTETETNHDQVD